MEVEKKALYNLLRMNWLNDPSLEVEPWQVQDYRILSLKELFGTLDSYGISLNQRNFDAFAEDVGSPEELADLLIDSLPLDALEQDHVYLMVFELWRRLLPERQCLTIFCDELDHQVYLFDQGDPSGAESIQDAVANLQMVMDENADQGVKNSEIYATISACCANDLESFLYDFISDQLEINNTAYAQELIEGFIPYFKGSKWFELLEIRLLEETDPEKASDQLRKLIQRNLKGEDLIFNFELLSFLIQGGKGEFNKVVRKTVPLMRKEEDFLDLLSLCSDYYRYLDEEQKEREVQELIDAREPGSLDAEFSQKDPALERLLKILR